MREDSQGIPKIVVKIFLRRWRWYIKLIILLNVSFLRHIPGMCGLELSHEG